MARIAFCGLGQMGRPMAERLLEAGHELTVWNRSPEPVQALAERGAAAAGSPAEAARDAEAAITMLTDAEAVRSVVLGDDGVAGGLQPGSTLIEMSTIGPEAVREIREALPTGVGMIDAPVQGSVPQAEAGSLRLWVGGDEAEVDRWLPVLEVLGGPRHVGPIGSGAALKLVMNSTLGASIAGIGEALALGTALGLDQATVLDALAVGPLQTHAAAKREAIMSGSFDPTFKLSLAAKDLGLVTTAAEAAGVRLRVAEAARAWFEAAAEAGMGDADYSALIAYIRDRRA